MNIRTAEKIAFAPIGLHRRGTFLRAVRLLRRREAPAAPIRDAYDLTNYVWHRRRGAVPIDLFGWARALGRRDRARIVAQTQVGERWISTVFLGIDHGWGQRHAPVLWETMIFGPPQLREIFGTTRMMALDTEEEDSGARYTSRWDALADHERIVRKLRIMAPPLPTVHTEAP